MPRGKGGSHGSRVLHAGPQPAPSPLSPRRALGPGLSSAAPGPGCAGVLVQTSGSPSPRSGAGEREQRKRSGCRAHRYELPSSRPNQALRFPPRFSSSLSTQIQETINSHSFLVTKKKGKLLFHPLHVPCFHQVHKAR